MVSVSLKDATIPHEIIALRRRENSAASGFARHWHYCGKTVVPFWNPPASGYLTKSLGSKNAANVVKATLNALLSLRTREQIYTSRGLPLKKVAAPKAPEAIAA